MALNDIYSLEVQYHVKQSIIRNRVFVEEVSAETAQDVCLVIARGFAATWLPLWRSLLGNDVVMDSVTVYRVTGTQIQPARVNFTASFGSQGSGDVMPPQSVIMVQGLADEPAGRARGIIKIRGFLVARLSGNSFDAALLALLEAFADAVILQDLPAAGGGTGDYHYRVMTRAGVPKPPFPGVPLTPDSRVIRPVIVQSKRTRNKFQGVLL